MKLSFFALVFTFPLLAQVTLDPVRGVGKEPKDPINLSRLSTSGPNAAVFKQVLENDLKLSGYFVIDPNAMTAVTGSATDAANGLNASANVSWAGKSFAWNNAATPADARRSAHALADEIVQKIKGKRGMASSRVLFVKRSGPNDSDLFVCDADGGNITQLTFDNRAVVGPKWDTDSRHLFLTSYISGGPAVYRMAAEPRAPKTTISRYNGLNTSAAPSPDGKTLALILSVTGNPDLFLLDRATGKLTQLTKTPRASEASPVWSPDGKSILYVSDASGAPQIYVLDVASRQSRRVTTSGTENVNPSWCRVTNRICYASRRDGKYQIAVLESLSAPRPVILNSGPYDHSDPTWAPDGRHILCSRADTPQSSSLWMLDTGGDNAVRLFSLPGKWASPAWSYR